MASVSDGSRNSLILLTPTHGTSVHVILAPNVMEKASSDKTGAEPKSETVVKKRPVLKALWTRATVAKMRGRGVSNGIRPGGQPGKRRPCRVEQRPWRSAESLRRTSSQSSSTGGARSSGPFLTVPSADNIQDYSVSIIILCSMLLSKAKRRCLLTCKVSIYCTNSRIACFKVF